MGIEGLVTVAVRSWENFVNPGICIKLPMFQKTCVRPWILYTPKRRWCEKFIFFNLNVLFLGGPRKLCIISIEHRHEVLTASYQGFNDAYPSGICYVPSELG